MDKRAEYLIQVLGQIGSPLMSSIILAEETDEPEKAATRMAELLGKTVELGISMANMADLSSVENDSVRVALTGLASPLIGQLHTSGKQTPSENDLKRVASALQAVLTFSENFTPDEDNTERLKNLEANGAGGDAHQITVQYMQAYIPAVNAISAFAFGQPEQKLIMDVSSKLTAKAESLRASLLGDLPEEQNQALDLAILKTLVALYAACHEAETKRLSDAPESDGGIEKVWASFDTRAAMMEALAGSLLPGGAPSPEPESEAPKEETSVPTETPEPAPEAAPAPAAEEPKAAAPAGANPMSMFAKPKAENSAPHAEEPKAEAPSEPQASPDMDAEEKSEDTSSSEGSSGESSGGGPMSFFKKPD